MVFEDLLGLVLIVIFGLLVLLLVIYFLLLNKFIKALRVEDFDMWESLGKPRSALSIAPDNASALLKALWKEEFVSHSKKISDLSKNIKLILILYALLFLVVPLILFFG